MEPIGGYFSLEFPHYEEFHKNAIQLNTGRNSLEYILRVRGYSKVYIPYYICNVVLEPFRKLGIPFEYYHININLELANDIHLNRDEALLYINYYGLKQRYTEKLANLYGNHLIVDNTQAFYAKPIAGIDTFYTCRKFFGVPDGAYLYTDQQLDMELEQDLSYDRMDSLTKRIDLSPEAGYKDFNDIRKLLIGQPIKRMSKLTQRMMQGIDYETIAQRRRANYEMLHQALGCENCLELQLENDAVPMVYPYLVPTKGLREKLIENKIFVARYWPNVLERTTTDDIDYQLAFQMQPLPIDQRYGEEEMKRIIEVLSSFFPRWI